MKTIINKIFQIIIDVAIGLSIYYFLEVLIPAGGNSIVIISLFTTAIFAEFVETRIKK